jgi:hypothetical protein
MSQSPFSVQKALVEARQRDLADGARESAWPVRSKSRASLQPGRSQAAVASRVKRGRHWHSCLPRMIWAKRCSTRCLS